MLYLVLQELLRDEAESSMRYKANIAIKKKRSEMEDRQIQHMIDSTYGIDGQRLKVCQLQMWLMIYCYGNETSF